MQIFKKKDNETKTKLQKKIIRLEEKLEQATRMLEEIDLKSHLEELGVEESERTGQQHETGEAGS